MSTIIDEKTLDEAGLRAAISELAVKHVDNFTAAKHEVFGDRTPDEVIQNFDGAFVHEIILGFMTDIYNLFNSEQVLESAYQLCGEDNKIITNNVTRQAIFKATDTASYAISSNVTSHLAYCTAMTAINAGYSIDIVKQMVKYLITKVGEDAVNRVYEAIDEVNLPEPVQQELVEISDEVEVQKES